MNNRAQNVQCQYLLYRKPLVTRKVLSDDEDDVTTNDDDSQMTNGHMDKKKDVEEIPEDLPEGNIIDLIL